MRTQVCGLVMAMMVMVAYASAQVTTFEATNYITTIAGIGTGGYNGDSNLATDANLFHPFGVTVNSLGEVLIADSNRVRKILLNGLITTIAGTGNGGYNGDGILATSANVYYPTGISVNSLTDEVLIADSYNHRVRKISGVCPPNSFPYCQKCNCLNGYFGYGQYCDKCNCGGIVNYRQDVCSSNGKCVSPNNCTCNSGYYGTDCELYNCYNIIYNDTRVCSSFGSCIAPNNCTCNTGYYGTYCDQFDCYGTPKTNVSGVCSGSGQCTGPNKCKCNSGWNGTYCEIPLCDGIQSGDDSVCNGHGSCITKDLCNCSQGWGSTFCNVPKCNGTLASQTSTVCGGHGYCSAPDVCNCTNNNYGGQFCTIPICNGTLANSGGVVCNGHGLCNSDAKCECTDVNWGPYCEIPKCTNQVFVMDTVLVPTPINVFVHLVMVL